jgi:hypothetical protein
LHPVWSKKELISTQNSEKDYADRGSSLPFYLLPQERVAWQDHPAGLEAHRHIKGQLQPAIDRLSDEVVDVPIFHPIERTMDGQLTLEASADSLVHGEVGFPIVRYYIIHPHEPFSVIHQLIIQVIK